jgi:hypothetical protein
MRIEYKKGKFVVVPDMAEFETYAGAWDYITTKSKTKIK